MKQRTRKLLWEFVRDYVQAIGGLVLVVAILWAFLG